MANLFNSFIFEPILQTLLWIYNTLAFNDLGFAIIILTIFIRFILFPFFYKSSKDQALIRKLQPQVDAIKENHKEDKEKQAEELMNLYKDHKLNPFSGFLLLIIQIPIFIGLFKIFKNPDIITETFSNHTLFGMVNLVKTSIPLVIFASAIQYIQGKISLSTKSNDQKKGKMAKFGKSMIYFMPFISFLILSQLPSALAVYWITSTIFSAGQNHLVNKKVADIDLDKPKNDLEYKKEDEEELTDNKPE